MGMGKKNSIGSSVFRHTGHPVEVVALAGDVWCGLQEISLAALVVYETKGYDLSAGIGSAEEVPAAFLSTSDLGGTGILYRAQYDQADSQKGICF
jgi:hypothetical protein